MAWWGAPKRIIENNNPEQVLSFVREKDENTVLAVFNLSAEAQSVLLMDKSINGLYDQFKEDASVTLKSGEAISLEPWGYRVFIQ